MLRLHSHIKSSLKHCKSFNSLSKNQFQPSNFPSSTRNLSIASNFSPNFTPTPSRALKYVLIGSLGAFLTVYGLSEYVLYSRGERSTHEEEYLNSKSPDKLDFDAALNKSETRGKPSANNPNNIITAHPNVHNKPKLVILGTGWGAVSVLKDLKMDTWDVVVISPRNYFLFTPLLPSATTGTLESRSLVEPIRRLCYSKHARYYECRGMDLDLKERLVVCRDDTSGGTFTVPYDELVIAVGAKNNTFNTPGVKEYAHFLKEVTHARKIRSHLLNNFEEAELPSTTCEERDRLLHFVVVGGGPTGVEFVGELHDFIKHDAYKAYPTTSNQVRISLLQSSDHILNTYDEAISRYAEEQFKKMDINVIFNARVQQVNEKSVVYLDKATNKPIEVPFGLCVWSTGIDTVGFTRRLIAKMPQTQSNKKCIVTDSRLRVLGKETEGRIYAIGDCATPYIPKLAEKAEALFELADENGDGKISRAELGRLAREAAAELPLLAAHLRKAEKEYVKYLRGKKNEELDLEDFKALLEEADKSLKAYPATAQVAAQQGEYMAKRFNAIARKVTELNTHRARQPSINLDASASQLLLDEKDNKPFAYHHLGYLAYIGNDKAAIDLGGGRYISGWSAFWLWKSVYLSKQVSMRTRLALAFDWFKAAAFGRDTSQY
jgi:NADH dehydrogenase